MLARGGTAQGRFVEVRSGELAKATHSGGQVQFGGDSRMTSAGRQALSKPLAFTAAAAGCLVLAVVALNVERIRAGQASLRVQQHAELLEGAQSDSKTSDWEGILAWSVKKAAKARLQAKAVRSSLATKGSSHHIRALPGSVTTKSSQLWVAPDVAKFNLTLPRCKYNTHIGRLDGGGCMLLCWMWRSWGVM